jgi:hypothetical protein
MDEVIFQSILGVWFILALLDTVYTVTELEFNFYLLKDRLQLQTAKVRYTVLAICSIGIFVSTILYVPIVLVKSMIDRELWYPGKYSTTYSAYLIRKLRRKFHN